MAGKKIFIEYDIDSSDLKIANGETLSLTQQLRLLKKELQKGDLKPEQFDILRKKIGDTEDQIAKTTVKSKDFFGVLSALPGPVGQFGGSLLGVVDTLKIFSSFSFKDIKNSLGDVADDVVEITSNFLGLKNATEDVKVTNDSLATSSNASTSALNQQAVAAGATAGAIQTQARETQLLTVETDKNGQSMIKAVKPYSQMSEAERELFAQQKKRTIAQIDLAEGSKKATTATTVQTVATQGLTIAERAATFATNALKIALASLGIGLVIIAVTALIELISGWITSTEEADAANQALNETIKEQERLLQVNLKAIDAATKQQIARAKIAGKTEEEIFQIQKKAGEDRLNELKDNDNKILQQIQQTQKNTVITQEQKNKILDDLNAKSLKSNQDIIDQINANEQASLDFQVTVADKKRAKQKEANDKTLAQQKEYNQKVINDTKTAEDQLAELIRGNSELRIRDERDRQFQELKNQKQVEEDKIKALLISEELRGKLLEQVRLKYGYKLLNMNQKFVDEDLKQLKDFQRKREDIEIAAIEDKIKREDKERQAKLQREIEDLEEDKEFVKLSETQKEQIRKNIRQKYANEDKEIKKGREKQEQDDRLKKLDDELRFLQIRQDSLRAGTKAFWDGQRDILMAAEAREIEAAEGKEKEITAIKDKYVKLRKDLDQQEKLATLAAIGETIGAFGNLTAAIASSYDEEAKTSKSAFEKRKKLQIATATMSAASGIIQILAQPSTLPSPFDWIVKGINAAALAISTAVQIKNIKNTQFEGGDSGSSRTAGTVRGMANGGIVRGPGGPKSDSVPTNLSNGEAVLTSGAVTMFAPLLSMMNQMGGGTSFSSDLSVASSDNPIRNNPAQEQTPVIMKTYVVERELTTSQEKQARLKDLSTL
jgi:hypothetical protein